MPELAARVLDYSNFSSPIRDPLKFSLLSYGFSVFLERNPLLSVGGLVDCFSEVFKSTIKDPLLLSLLA